MEIYISTYILITTTILRILDIFIYRISRNALLAIPLPPAQYIFNLNKVCQPQASLGGELLVWTAAEGKGSSS
jgi:hypothetical protein